jgi:hypothetical protein
MMSENVEELVAKYIDLRDKKKAVQEEADLKVAAIDEEMKEISSVLLERCKDIGADSIRTGLGTVIRSVKARYWTSNWDALYDTIVDNDAFGLLEKRIHQSNMKSFLEENPDLHPEGLNVDKEYAITVRRK